MGTKINIEKKGFTLIELLVVIAIIGVLSSVVLVSVDKSRIRLRNATRIESVESIANALQIATTGTTNQFPTSNFNQKCLGKTACWINEYLNLPSLDALVKSAISGGTIPLDPYFKDLQFGDAILYISGVNMGRGVGAYITWAMEDLGVQSCGRGFINIVLTPIMAIGTYACSLYLGPSAP